jgi:pimeloyl-ACP methyl ester carboxylesterase
MSETPGAGTLDVDGWTVTAHDVALSDGRGIHYLDARRSDGGGDRELLALHGMGSFGAAWLGAIQHMPTVGRAILPDFRGHGHSDWTMSGYWLADYAADTEELVGLLGLAGFDLAGHSLGARVSMVMAARLAVTTVTLSDTGPEVSRSGALKAKSIAATGSTSRSYRNRDAIATALREEHPDWVQAAIDVRVRDLFRENWAGRFVPRGDPEVEHLLGRPGLKEVDDMWAGLGAIDVPTLLVRGRDSFLLDDELAQRMVSTMQHPTYVELPLTHEMLYVRPDLFGAAVGEFLAAH